ncbi:MAG: haloacid dehalogenase-like hydrolase [Sphingobacteriaceae bacterium]|nr:haloacid dehalogenase-like hydrolase [Sphingobacteriaceae bacterium]
MSEIEMIKTLVLFDFDGTLTKQDTFPKFVFFSQGYFKGILGFLIFSPHVFLFLLRLMNGAKLKEKLVAFYFKGEKEEVLNKKGSAFIDKLTIENGFNKDVLNKFENHVPRSCH